jgi:hypothetical protein
MVEKGGGGGSRARSVVRVRGAKRYFFWTYDFDGLTHATLLFPIAFTRQKKAGNTN